MLVVTSRPIPGGVVFSSVCGKSNHQWIPAVSSSSKVNFLCGVPLQFYKWRIPESSLQKSTVFRILCAIFFLCGRFQKSNPLLELTHVFIILLSSKWGDIKMCLSQFLNDAKQLNVWMTFISMFYILIVMEELWVTFFTEELMQANNCWNQIISLICQMKRLYQSFYYVFVFLYLSWKCIKFS